MKNFKRINTLVALMIMLAVTLAFTGPVFAKDVMLDTQVEQVVTKLDKNGVEYTRFIIQEERDLNGLKYKTDVVVMAFGTSNEKAKTFSPGDKVKMIASINEYQGRKNYNVVAFVN